jgi:meiosis-specific serine/threonine-protein kinase MEK1
VHIWKEHPEKLTLFEPTPPLRPAHKVLSYPKTFFALISVWQYIGNYVVTSQCLGSGSFATVNLAIDPARYRQVACKSIRTKRDYDVDQVMKEVRILMTLKHVSDIIVLFIVLVTSSSAQHQRNI